MTAAGTVFDAVAAHARHRPGAPALTGGGRTWTYEKLCDDADRVAGRLAAAGAGPGEPFAVVAGNEAWVCVAWLAGHRSGAVPSLMNSLLTPPELGWVLGHLAPRVVLAGADHAPLA